MGIVGFLLILGVVLDLGNKISYLTDWSTGEMWGYNVFTLLSVFGGGYLIYYALRKRV